LPSCYYNPQKKRQRSQEPFLPWSYFQTLASLVQSADDLKACEVRPRWARGLRSDQSVRQMRGRSSTQQAKSDHCRDTQRLTLDDLPGLEPFIGKNNVRTTRSPMLAAANAKIEAATSATAWLNMVAFSMCVLQCLWHEANHCIPHLHSLWTFSKMSTKSR
jgi:hypothetical protein